MLVFFSLSDIVIYGTSIYFFPLIFITIVTRFTVITAVHAPKTYDQSTLYLLDVRCTSARMNVGGIRYYNMSTAWRLDECLWIIINSSGNSQRVSFIIFRKTNRRIIAFRHLRIEQWFERAYSECTYIRFMWTKRKFCRRNALWSGSVARLIELSGIHLCIYIYLCVIRNVVQYDMSTAVHTQ